MKFNPGDTIDGKYRVVRRIGEGSMGTVYEGENVRIGRRVAIKVIHSDVERTPELLARFESEAQAATKAGSPHVCEVLDLGDLPEGDKYIVMEYLDGQSLEELLQSRGRMPLSELLPIICELLEGIHALHTAGIIHRDLKPANVFIVRQGPRNIVKILDFGVSKNVHSRNAAMTSTGTVMGTPLYMSPEQARGLRSIDGRVDVYAVGVMLYYALSGRLPFDAENFHQLLFKIALEEPITLETHVPELEPQLLALVKRGMAKKADERFASAREFQRALLEWAKEHGLSQFIPASLREIMGPLTQRSDSLPRISAAPPTRVAPVDTTTAWADDKLSAKGSGSGPLPQPLLANSVDATLVATGSRKRSKGPLYAMGAVGVAFVGILIFFTLRSTKVEPESRAAATPTGNLLPSSHAPVVTPTGESLPALAASAASETKPTTAAEETPASDAGPNAAASASASGKVTAAPVPAPRPGIWIPPVRPRVAVPSAAPSSPPPSASVERPSHHAEPASTEAAGTNRSGQKRRKFRTTLD